MSQNILLVDDDAGILQIVTSFLEKNGYHVYTAPHLQEARRVMEDESVDAIILDYNLPDGKGIDWLPALRSKFPSLAIIMITGEGDIPLAVTAMQSGADHFICKPVNLKELKIFLEKSLEVRALRRESIHARRLKKTAPMYWGDSEKMKQVKKFANTAAGSATPVLLLGETGTGKGMLAHWIHEQSDRKGETFVEINCNSLRGELLASELFGHKKGAFTSAIEDKQGLVEIAHNGTLFLDEIGDMELEIQAQLLKIIEEKQYRRLGDTKVIRSDFRLICATNQDLHQAITRGRFRQDLYYRINVFPILLPCLNERKSDITGLVEYFLHDMGASGISLSSKVKEMLTRYHWPGNIRELRNVLERALLFCDGDELDSEHFTWLASPDQPVTVDTDTMTLEAAEALHIQKVLLLSGNDTQKAADILGISRASLYRKMNKYKLK